LISIQVVNASIQALVLQFDNHVRFGRLPPGSLINGIAADSNGNLAVTDGKLPGSLFRILQGEATGKVYATDDPKGSATAIEYDASGRVSNNMVTVNLTRRSDVHWNKPTI
jgi:YD repeat-containing protein